MTMVMVTGCPRRDVPTRAPPLASLPMKKIRSGLAVRSLLTVVALFVAEILGSLAAVAVPREHEFLGLVVAACGVALAAFGLAVALTSYVDKRPVRSLGLAVDRPALRGSLLGLAVVGGAVGLATALCVAFGLTRENVVSTPTLAFILVQAFVLQAVPEELLFRGYLVGAARERLSAPGVIVLSSLVFGAPHILSRSDATTWAQRLLFLTIPVGFGAVAAVLRLTSGSLWPAVAVHGGFHVSVWVGGLWVAARPQTYGTYLSVFGGTLLATAAALTVWAVRTGRLPQADPLPQAHPLSQADPLSQAESRMSPPPEETVIRRGDASSRVTPIAVSPPSAEALTA
jgi:membrane protease YdiL (CAAX protease family)